MSDRKSGDFVEYKAGGDFNRRSILNIPRVKIFSNEVISKIYGFWSALNITKRVSERLEVFGFSHDNKCVAGVDNGFKMGGKYHVV